MLKILSRKNHPGCGCVLASFSKNHSKTRFWPSQVGGRASQLVGKPSQLAGCPSQVGKHPSQPEIRRRRPENGRHKMGFPMFLRGFARTDRKMAARMDFRPHGRENGRTERFIAARRGKSSAQTGFEAVGSDFYPHGVLTDGHHADSHRLLLREAVQRAEAQTKPRLCEFYSPTVFKAAFFNSSLK